ncbi:hypothetical protein GCM10023063_26020 [Arthrobacter methylotrophus]
MCSPWCWGSCRAAGLNPVITTLAVGSIVYGLVAITTKGAVVTAGSVDVAWLATWNFLEISLPVYIFVKDAAFYTS